jgi:hypothetical protein
VVGSLFSFNEAKMCCTTYSLSASKNFESWSADDDLHSFAGAQWKFSAYWEDSGWAG